MTEQEAMGDWPGTQIIGAKILVLRGTETLVYLRDNRPDIAYPGVWDIPGGGREGAETPRQTAVRELDEETGLRIEGTRLVPLALYPAQVVGHVAIYRLDLTHEDGPFRFGAEGSQWQWEPLAAFLARTDAVEPLRRAAAAALSKGGF